MYTFWLEVSDGQDTAAASVRVTVVNAPPEVAASGGGTFTLGEELGLQGTVADWDGDPVSYVWRAGAQVLASGEVATPGGGAAVGVTGLRLEAAALGLGEHEIELAASDGHGAEAVATICVEVVDRTPPELAPVASHRLLWPPNHCMVEVTIAPHAADDSGGPIALQVEFSCSDPESSGAQDDLAPDFELLEVDAAADLVRVSLRAERLESGSA